MNRPNSQTAKAEKRVLRAAVACIDKYTGCAFRIATESIAGTTYFINEGAFQNLEQAVANLKEARRKRK